VRIGFGPWEPDSAGVETGTLLVAKNVYPAKVGYIPISSLSAITSTPLPDRCVGAISVRTSAGGFLIFAGTTSKLYKYQAGTWIDYTRVSGGNYSVPVDEFWSFAIFGSKLIAVNINDDAQVIDVDTGATAFAALAGTPPKARYATVVGSFVVLGCLSSDNRAVRNSAIEDETGWTVGTSLCDEQTFPDGGRVTGIAGGEFGYVAQERVLRRMIFQPGNDIAFRFERIESERGCAAGYGLIATGGVAYFPSNDGFYAYGPNGLVPIGAQRVNKWFRSNSDTTRFFSVLAFADPYAPRICWAFYNSGGSTYFDRVIIYDWNLDRWSYMEVTAQYWASITTAGVTLEELDVYGDIDGGGIPYPFDSRAWEGGAPVIGAFDSGGLLSFLEGSLPQTAVLSHAPNHLAPGFRATVQSVYPLGVFNGATISVRVGKRENTSNSPSYTAAASPSSLSGIIRFKAGARVHDFETTISQSSGTSWTLAQGIDVEARQSGRK
jgi:hypothetical protein